MAPKATGKAKAKAAVKKDEPTKTEEKAEEKEEKVEKVEKEEGVADVKAEDVEMKDEVAKEEEPSGPKELEEDSKPDKRAKVKEGTVALNPHDCTLNAMLTLKGKLLMSLTEGGMQYLLASCRANAGIKSGRYMFEARIVENLNPVDGQQGPNRPQPRQLIRLGFSTAGSSLFLGDGGEDNVCFDGEGFFNHGKTKKKVFHKRLGKDQTVAVLLNMESGSPNANTVSLFVDGVRAAEPVALPEHLVGKALFPTITYKNMSIEANLGSQPRSMLPFSCTMVGAAATADLEITKPPKDGKPEVVFPVGLPDQGYFEWCDEFIEKNPGFVELSDRKVLEWATKSGVFKRSQAVTGSNDKPDGRFGIPSLDDWSVTRVLNAIAPTVSRNYLVPELKANLTVKDRSESLLRFNSNDFSRKAMVIMGEPAKEFKDRVQAKILADKQAIADAEAKKKAAEAERKRQVEERKKKAEESRKAAQAAREAALKKRQAEAAGEDAEAKDEKAPEESEGKAATEGEEKADEEAAQEGEGQDEKMEEAKVDEEVPAPVELTEEEKNQFYPTSELPDITERELARSFASFSLPTKTEGFDLINFAWQKEAACSTLLTAWVREKKLTMRAEELQPGDEFKELWSKWQKTLQEWRRKQAEFRDPARRRAAEAQKAEEAKKKLEEEKKALIEAGDEEGAKALDEKAAEEAAKGEEEDATMEDLDVMSVEDILDIGNGEPLFANFAYEDWTLLATRYELHLLVHSFKKDLNDADRPSFALKHLSYYYNKYYKKSWSFQQFGLKDFDDLLDLINGSISLPDGATGFLKADQPEDAPIESFLKLAEDNRRERQRRIEAGDETAKLKFTRQHQGPPQRHDDKGYGKGGNTGGKGGGKGASAPLRSYGGAPSQRSQYGGAPAAPSYGGQKRSYPPAPSSYGGPAKTARTSYGGAYGGSGSGGGYRR
eukprot:TRINITY_DN2920_c0_g1_i1.p1 TRINITY_DN2920_c0_g1~~TRINITY_DN2920_c0_g1_i1.p1  ORF type:complete len:966 (+),score=324.01 TRINITY_DN2920_c0_g1_i1:68-2899(+)